MKKNIDLMHMNFVERNFYINDKLKSLPIEEEEEAIDLLKRIEDTLATANLRLPKIVYNSGMLLVQRDLS